MSSGDSSSETASTAMDAPARDSAGVVAIDEETCGGCAMCVLVCPTERLMMVGRRKNMKARLREDRTQCMACGACQAICDTGAIVVVLGYDFGPKWKQIDRGDPSPPRVF